MKSKSLLLFIISITIVLLTTGIATFWEYLEMQAYSRWLAIAITVAFGIGIGGFVLGIVELGQNRNKNSWIGLIGNVFVILFFLAMVIYSFQF